MKYKDMSGYESGKNFGQYNDINSDFKYGKNISVGSFNVILHDVIVGDNVDIQHHTLLKPGTIIGDDCYIDSYVLTSGDCQIGNNVILRYRTVIARNVIIEDNNFLTAGVKTIYLDHSAQVRKKPLLIKKGNFFGDNVILMGGLTLAENCVFGAGAFVNKDTEPMGVYVGTPAKRIRDVSEDELWWRK